MAISSYVITMMYIEHLGYKRSVYNLIVVFSQYIVTYTACFFGWAWIVLKQNKNSDIGLKISWWLAWEKQHEQVNFS